MTHSATSTIALKQVKSLIMTVSITMGLLVGTLSLMSQAFVSPVTIRAILIK